MRYPHLFLLLVVFVWMSCQQREKVIDSDLSAKGKILIEVPLTRQAHDYTCGVAALQSVLYYYGDEWRQDRLEVALQSDSLQGTNYRNIIRFCDSLGYKTKTYSQLSVDSLKLFVQQGFPMILAIQAWADAGIDYSNEWDNGHYVICVGYDENNLYFMDPSTIGNYTYIPIDEFLERWHDTDQEGLKLYNFAIQIFKPERIYQPERILRLE